MSSGRTTLPNTQVLEICKISGIEAFLISAQLRSTGHVICMSENRLPKQAFYSQLEYGTRSRGGQRKRYKDMLKHNLQACMHYRSEGTRDISRGQIIVACDVQSFGATLRVSKRRSDPYAKQAEDRQLAALGYLRHVWPHLCFSNWSLLTPPNSSSSSVTRYRRVDGSVHHQRSCTVAKRLDGSR